jgi:recombination protein RecA
MAETGRAALSRFTTKMQTKYGAGRISNDPPPVIVPTGSLTLNFALGVGGFQQGRIYELLGPKDSSKSTVAIHSMAIHQAMFPDRGVIYVNMERTFSAAWAAGLGLDCTDDALASGRWQQLQPKDTEEASDLARDYVGSKLFSILVLDSIGSLESGRTLEKDAARAADAMGRNAKIITQLTKALATMAREAQCTVLLINQPRANLGGMGGDISAGPKAMQHSTTAKIEFRHLGGADHTRTLKRFGEDQVVGVEMRAKVTRSKNFPPGRVAEYFVMNQATREYGPAGIDTLTEVITTAPKLGGLVAGGGGIYTLPDGTKLKGREAVREHLTEHPQALEEIQAACKFDQPEDILPALQEA